MAETTQSIKWICGKCGRSPVYREDDRLVGDFCLACPICGNRYYNSVGRKGVGVAPVRKDMASTAITEIEDHELKRKDDDMTGNGICKNCGRERFLLGGLCSMCSQAGRGLKGDAKEKALADVKEKIKSGQIQKSGRKKKPIDFGLAGGDVNKFPILPDDLPGDPVIDVGKQDVIVPQDIPVRIRLMVEIAVRLV